jgi:hypothetical protein
LESNEVEQLVALQSIIGGIIVGIIGAIIAGIIVGGESGGGESGETAQRQRDDDYTQ